MQLNPLLRHHGAALTLGQRQIEAIVYRVIEFDRDFECAASQIFRRHNFMQRQQGGIQCDDGIFARGVAAADGFPKCVADLRGNQRRRNQFWFGAQRLSAVGAGLLQYPQRRDAGVDDQRHR